MTSEQKKAEASCTNEPRSWPVSLLGCLQGTPSTNQLPWPWLMFKSCLCPAAVLGENETLFQGEEPADVCCLQPYSFCGPTCRVFNAELCGFGNEGLKLCAHTCVVQLVCSCMCLGLPYVAWLAALQRQRVMTKHGVAATDEEAMATACYPCNLLQMHALLQQQQHQQQQSVMNSRHPQQQQQQSVPLRAPRVQQMTAASEAPSQASSYAGPLTSAMTTSKVLRTVRDHATRSEGTVPLGGGMAPGGSMRQGVRHSHDSTCSSQVSETGVVNSPMVSKQQSEAHELGNESSRSRGDLSAQHSRRTSARTSHDGSGSHHKQRPQPSNGQYLRPPPPVQQQQPEQLGPLRSARGQSSSGGGAGYGSQQPLLPLRHGMSRHSRTVSLGGEPSGSTAADAACAEAFRRCSDVAVPTACSSELPTPEPSSSGAVRSNKRKLPGRAAAASQSCHLPSGSGLQPLQDDAPSTPPHAVLRAAGADAAGSGTDGSCGGPASSCTSLQPGMLGSSVRTPQLLGSSSKVPVTGSCSKVPISGSCSKLVTFSQEDVPLSAFKANARRASLGANPADVSRSAGGWTWSGSRVGNLADSMQQQSDAACGVPAAADGKQAHSSGSGGGPDGGAPAVEQQVQRMTGDGSTAGAARAGLAALVSLEADSSHVQVDPQYATMQSDMCNFASWLGDAPAGLSRTHSNTSGQQQQQGQRDTSGSDHEEQGQQDGPSSQQQRSEGDLCNYDNSTTPLACSPTQAVSPAALSAGTGPSGATPAATAASSAAAAAGARAAAAAIANSSRPTVLAAAWAYMSDICNLGGSFEAASSTICRTGLAAAVLSRLAEDSSSNQHAREADAADPAAGGRPSSSGVSSSSASGSSGVNPQPGSAAAAAAAGSWPDTAPSPPFATLVTGGTLDSAVAGAAAAAAAAGVAQQQRAASHSAAVDEDEDGEVSSPPRRKRRADRDDSNSSGEVSAAATATGSRPGSNGSSRGGSSSRGQPAASPAGAVSAVDGLDPQMLAAVIGTTQREQLTASQEELATKLARLAFANPAAARQLAGSQQQQRLSRGGSGGFNGQQQEQQQQQQLFEPFFPTMMSDICNLADPEEEQGALPRENSNSILAERVQPAATSAQQQQWTARDSAGQRGSGRPPMPPQAAAAAGPNRKPNAVPGRPMRQQQQQQQQPYSLGMASRLGRPAGMAGSGSNAAAAVAAAAAASGSSDTAGPLRAALLLRGMRAPGGPGQLGAMGSGAAAGAAGAAGQPNRRMAVPGDAAGDARVAAACAGGGGLGPGYVQHRPGDNSLNSFDSFYVDCDLPPTQELRYAAVEAANMITNNPLYTLTASENGGTADSSRMSPGLKQQLRNAGNAATAAAGVGNGGEERLSQQQQQWHAGAGSERGPKGAAAGPAAGRSVDGAGRSDHDDDAQQPDNSRSNSPCPGYAAADAGAYATGASAAATGKKAGERGVFRTGGLNQANAGYIRAGQLQHEYDAA